MNPIILHADHLLLMDEHNTFNRASREWLSAICGLIYSLWNTSVTKNIKFRS